MIVLDASVICEPWKVEPDPRVVAWIDGQKIETLYPSTITMAALRFGPAAMPDGRRRAIDQERLEREVLPAFSRRILSSDLGPSQAYAALRHGRGRPAEPSPGGRL